LEIAMSYPAKLYVTAFLNHREPLLEVLEKIPADQGDFRFYPEGESLREIVDQFFECDAEVIGELTGNEPNTDQSPDLRSAIARLRAYTEPYAQLIGGLSPVDLERVLWSDEDDDAMRVCDLIEHYRNHEIHHKGQIWMAARMMGIEVPRWVKQRIRLGDSK
jgi:uncharacterized damage-inducible protein DinB